MPKTKATQIKASGIDLELVNVEIPEPKQNEVLINIEACGICYGMPWSKKTTSQGYPIQEYPGTKIYKDLKKC